MWEKIILACDVDSQEELEELLKKKPSSLTQLKAGWRLYAALGHRLFRTIPEDHRLFLDLKLHDIPSVVAASISQFRCFPIWFLTVHCAGGERMLRAAKEAAGDMQLLGVTLLTSLSEQEVRMFGKNRSELVLSLAKWARETELAGVVCSAQEVPAVKQACPDLLSVCPGIRFEPQAEDDLSSEDQRAISTPEQALERGADYLVLGRPLLSAIFQGESEQLEKLARL